MDFYIAHAGLYFISLYPAEHVQFPFIARIVKNFYQLPPIKAYYERPTAVKKYLPDSAVLQVKDFNEDQVVLAYWKSAGITSFLRYLLSYYKVDFVEKFYEGEEGWPRDKQHINLDFPNLPYLYHRGSNFTERFAIANYIIETFGKGDLLGKDAKEAAKVQQLIGITKDIFKSLGPLAYDPEWKEHKKATLEKLEPFLANIAKSYGDK